MLCYSTRWTIQCQCLMCIFMVCSWMILNSYLQHWTLKEPTILMVYLIVFLYFRMIYGLFAIGIEQTVLFWALGLWPCCWPCLHEVSSLMCCWEIKKNQWPYSSEDWRFEWELEESRLSNIPITVRQEVSDYLTTNEYTSAVDLHLLLEHSPWCSSSSCYILQF